MTHRPAPEEQGKWARLCSSSDLVPDRISHGPRRVAGGETRPGGIEARAAERQRRGDRRVRCGREQQNQ